ncbi:hypothetical protein D3C75_810400 [compost metagenome]
MAEQAESLAFQFDDGEVQQAELAGLLPASGAYRGLVVGQAGGQGEQQHQGVLGHRRGAVALAVAHGDTVGAGGVEVDVVGAGGGDQYQLEFGTGGEGGGVQLHLVADRHLRALEAFGDLLRCGLLVQHQRAEHLAQRRQVEVAKVEGGMVEEYGSGHGAVLRQGQRSRKAARARSSAQPSATPLANEPATPLTAVPPPAPSPRRHRCTGPRRHGGRRYGAGR